MKRTIPLVGILALLAWEGGRFVDATERAGPGLEVVESSRGLAVGDIDGDGDLDLVVSNIDAPPTLLRNDGPAGGRWLLVDAPGALLAELSAGEAPGPRRWVRHRVHGSSYMSASDARFHFGLGPAPGVGPAPAGGSPPLRLRLVRLDGRKLVLHDPPVDAVLVVRP